MDATVTKWLGSQARPLTTLAPDAPFVSDGLELVDERARDAVVVAAGASTRQSHELSLLSHRIMRLLVERHGFRSLLLEGDETFSARLDEHVRTGAGDPHALLTAARPFWRTQEILNAVRWLRDYNLRHPDDPVHVAHGRPFDAEDMERQAAANTLDWHERTGHKIVYWGGISHTAISSSSPAGPLGGPSGRPGTLRSAGHLLRERFGAGYVSIGLLFHHGTIPVTVPDPPDEFAETVLDGAGPDVYMLDLHAAEQPDEVRRWVAGPTMTRLVGPLYDPSDDAVHHLSGGSLATWYDLVGYVREVTPVHLLDDR